MTPALLLLGALACRPAGVIAPSGLPATESIIGRARWQGHDMLLTDAPALIAVDRITGNLTRTSIETSPGQKLSPWGLAEADGRLFTISDFVRLVGVTPAGSIAEITTLERPLANLVDLPGGMAAQPSAAPAGSPLLVGLTGAGRISPLESPPRSDFGLTPAEESLLHLVACSASPRVVCWLPGDNRLLAFDDGALVEGVVLDGLDRIPGPTLIARLDRRVITDAVVSDDDRLVVLHEGLAGAPQQITTFDPRGRRLASAPAPEPLRLLVASEGRELAVISREGRVRRIRRP